MVGGGKRFQKNGMLWVVCMKDFSKVLVTGGAGFVGSHLVDELVGRGYKVVVLDNFLSGNIKNVSQHLETDGFKLVDGDVRDRRVVRDAMDGVDAVVHLAALIDVEESVKNPVPTHEVNVTGTLNVLEEAVRRGVKRFVYASSTAVYGELNPLPLNEDCPPRPVSPYAASKVSAEFYCKAFYGSYGLDAVVLRYFNVYGPRQERNPYSGVITRFLSNASSGEPLVIYGDGEQTRDFVYIDDVVDATMLALEGGSLADEIFNVCTGKPTAINELAQVVKEVSGRDVQIVYGKARRGDLRYNYGDPAKAEEVLGFRAKVTLRKGLECTYSEP